MSIDEYGLNLNSEEVGFSITLSKDSTFSPTTSIHLSRAWQDDMGLHLLQRSMLPQRVLKCMITLNNLLKISESYNTMMRRSVYISLSDLSLIKDKEVDSNYEIVLQVTTDKPVELLEHFEPSKFNLGRLAKIEMDARGFQMTTDARDGKIAVSETRHVRIVVENWRKIQDRAEFSPEIGKLVEIAKGGKVLAIVDGNGVEEGEVVAGKKKETKRPCACWKGEGGGDGQDHHDAYESHWAAMFDRHAENMKPKKAAGEGLNGSRGAR